MLFFPEKQNVPFQNPDVDLCKWYLFDSERIHWKETTNTLTITIYVSYLKGFDYIMLSKAGD
jgi:hypothetical protein